MKKLFLALVATLLFSFSYAQDDTSTVYRIYQAEFYTYSDATEKWTLETRNTDVNFDLVVYKNNLNIQAKTPTLFKVKVESKKFISGNGYYGYTFEALECVEEKICKLDYVYSTNNKNSFMLSVIFKDEVLGNVNLRYYSTLNN